MNTSIKILTKKIFFLLLVVGLLISNNVFAASADDLKSAFKDNNVKEIQQLLEDGANPNEIFYISDMPTPEVLTLLFENKVNSLEPTRFLRLIINAGIKSYNPETRKLEMSDKLVAQRNQLVKLSLDKGADPGRIPYLSYLPSIELSKILLENKNSPMDPGYFFKLVINTNVYHHNPTTGAYEIDNELAQKTDELIKISIDKGADPNTIDSLFYLPTIELSEALLENKKKPMDPGHFLRLIVNVDSGFIKHRNQLIELALDKGADPNAIDHLFYLPTIELSETLLENKKNRWTQDIFLD